MKIIFVNIRIILPCSAFKGGKPVVRRLIALTLAPYVVIVIRVINALCALLEPFVLIGGMIDNEIHKNSHSPLMRSLKNFLEIVKGAELGIDISVIGNIVGVGYIGENQIPSTPSSLR